jgi:hypothetical protein
MTLENLVNKVLGDPGFWNELRKNPGKASRVAGEKLTAEQIKALKGLNYGSLQDLAMAFDGGGAIT